MVQFSHFLSNASIQYGHTRLHFASSTLSKSFVAKAGYEHAQPQEPQARFPATRYDRAFSLQCWPVRSVRPLERSHGPEVISMTPNFQRQDPQSSDLLTLAEMKRHVRHASRSPSYCASIATKPLPCAFYIRALSGLLPSLSPIPSLSHSFANFLLLAGFHSFSIFASHCFFRSPS